MDAAWKGWKTHERPMREEVRTWEAAHPGETWEEDEHAFKARCAATAVGMSAPDVDSCTGKVRDVLGRLVAAKGWYIDG